jgi:hypothetical protein
LTSVAGRKEAALANHLAAAIVIVSDLDLQPLGEKEARAFGKRIFKEYVARRAEALAKTFFGYRLRAADENVLQTLLLASVLILKDSTADQDDKRAAKRFVEQARRAFEKNPSQYSDIAKVFAALYILEDLDSDVFIKAGLLAEFRKRTADERYPDGIRAIAIFEVEKQDRVYLPQNTALLRSWLGSFEAADGAAPKKTAIGNISTKTAAFEKLLIRYKENGDVLSRLHDLAEIASTQKGLVVSDRSRALLDGLRELGFMADFERDIPDTNILAFLRSLIVPVHFIERFYKPAETEHTAGPRFDPGSVKTGSRLSVFSAALDRGEDLEVVGSRLATSLARAKNAVIPMLVAGGIAVYSFFAATPQAEADSIRPVSFTIRVIDPDDFQNQILAEPTLLQLASAGPVYQTSSISGTRLSTLNKFGEVEATFIPSLETKALQTAALRATDGVDLMTDKGLIGFAALASSRRRQEESARHFFVNGLKVFKDVDASQSGVMAIGYSTLFREDGEPAPSDIYQAAFVLNQAAETSSISNITVAVYGPPSLKAKAGSVLQRLQLTAPRIRFIYAPVEDGELNMGLTQAVKSAVAGVLDTESAHASIVSIAYHEKYEKVLSPEDKISYVQVGTPGKDEYTSAMLLLLGFSFDADHIPASLAGYVNVVSITSGGKTIKAILLRPVPLTNAVIELHRNSISQTGRSA